MNEVKPVFNCNEESPQKAEVVTKEETEKVQVVTPVKAEMDSMTAKDKCRMGNKMLHSIKALKKQNHIREQQENV